MRKIYLFIFLMFLLSGNVYSNSFNILASINNNLITNYDLFMEIKLMEHLNKRVINEDQKIIILNELINNKIKELEVQKYNIALNNIEISKRVGNLIKDDNLENLRQRLKNKIITESKWNSLIYLKFRNKLEINMQEINKIISNTEIQEDKNKIIERERERKLNIISKTYFNEIKKNYFVKKL